MNSEEYYQEYNCHTVPHPQTWNQIQPTIGLPTPVYLEPRKLETNHTESTQQRSILSNTPNEFNQRLKLVLPQTPLPQNTLTQTVVPQTSQPKRPPPLAPAPQPSHRSSPPQPPHLKRTFKQKSTNSQATQISQPAASTAPVSSTSNDTTTKTAKLHSKIFEWAKKAPRLSVALQRGCSNAAFDFPSPVAPDLTHYQYENILEGLSLMSDVIDYGSNKTRSRFAKFFRRSMVRQFDRVMEEVNNEVGKVRKSSNK